MKIWHCSYRWSGGWGAYQEYEYVCVAETKERAIELAMKDTVEFGKNIELWSATEVDASKENACYISSQCS